jgi:hypothetical protein
MTETKSNLKLQLPSHHSYDLDDFSEALEAPSGLIENNNPIFISPSQRRKAFRRMRAGIVDSTKFDMKGANLVVPETPPTPDHNSALYPFLRLHQQMSSSSPDISNMTNKNKNSFDKQIDVDAHIYNKGSSAPGDALKQRSFTQPHNLNLLMMNSKNLSNSIAEQGLTASTQSVTSTDHESLPSTDFNNYASKIDHHGNERRYSDDKQNGFLTNLIFGNKNLFNGKALKVSAFDMTMCAPGST